MQHSKNTVYLFIFFLFFTTLSLSTIAGATQSSNMRDFEEENEEVKFRHKNGKICPDKSKIIIRILFHLKKSDETLYNEYRTICRDKLNEPLKTDEETAGEKRMDSFLVFVEKNSSEIEQQELKSELKNILDNGCLEPLNDEEKRFQKELVDSELKKNIETEVIKGSRIQIVAHGIWNRIRQYFCCMY